MKVKNFRPHSDRVLVLPHEKETLTSGGVHIPEGDAKDSTSGTVVALGVGTDREWECKEGDNIMFSKYAGKEITINGVQHKVLRQSDVIGDFEFDED